MVGSELNCTPGKREEKTRGDLFFFFVNFSPALYNLNACNRLRFNCLTEYCSFSALVTHTGFDTYCPFLTNLKDIFFFFFYGYWSARNDMFFQGTIFFLMMLSTWIIHVFNDVFIVYMFEFFNHTSLC